MPEDRGLDDVLLKRLKRQFSFRGPHEFYFLLCHASKRFSQLEEVLNESSVEVTEVNEFLNFFQVCGLESTHYDFDLLEVHANVASGYDAIEKGHFFLEELAFVDVDL